MTIISAYHEERDGEEKRAVSPEQYQEDYPKLLRKHQEALKQEPMWEFFGGTLTVEDRIYQVC